MLGGEGVNNLSEDEKKKLALELFAQETARLKNRRVFDTAADPVALRRMEKRQSIMASLAQKGITWEQLRDAYNEELSRGQRDMMSFRLSFFYAASAIVFQEHFPDSTPQAVADFMVALQGAPEQAEDTPTLNRKCLEETGFDAGVYDKPGISGPASRANMSTTAKASRKDEIAIRRMQESGITEADLEYERQAGYQNGWNSAFHFSACYASLGLVLYKEHGYGAQEIEAFVERVREVEDEEISVPDILERAEREAGVDVSELGEAGR